MAVRLLSPSAMTQVVEQFRADEDANLLYTPQEPCTPWVMSLLSQVVRWNETKTTNFFVPRGIEKDIADSVAKV